MKRYMSKYEKTLMDIIVGPNINLIKYESKKICPTIRSFIPLIIYSHLDTSLTAPQQ